MPILLTGCSQPNNEEKSQLSSPTIGVDELTAIDQYLTDLESQGMSGVVLIAEEFEITPK